MLRIISALGKLFNYDIALFSHFLPPDAIKRAESERILPESNNKLLWSELT